ncbi:MULTISPECIES: substrate-binding domain-containing protein [Ralstonia solanacearum species complex]|uniref:ABC transporter substrate-binding protein n=1 Tax=Ralstonia solanacearum species complex TaxID=3116862 RepID=UPI00078E418F|nr:substrate-binding domain-containing protein [Ralstonia solanacearum]BEU74552.1 substrate-binding domain-containing protein [Ralstonia pseudosolanacearum]AMP39982.1 sugar ABC transporter substrate-binding protein [Ralstonia solanacearum]AXV79403.1 sugar ABC transporter substrate-binding protein [Ralstonia solanacearum]AXV88825.1 sugar ABC transporter substrate-binding protein [Ralstonia solanacearum]AXV93424.1 sugar ABC transporter substrate-binding protein [Ralstonia solanacearum]
MKQTIGGCLLASVLWLAGLLPSQAQTVPRAWEQWLATASARHSQWSGPRLGPRAVTGATIAVVSEDLRNGGILGVAKGIKEAAGAIGWNTRVYDAGGTPAGRARAVASALALQPGGVILVGVDAREMQPQLQPFAERGIPMVGWHVSPFAGPIPGSPVAVNISTDPVAVARVTAMATIARSGGHAGIVVFTDSNFQIAKAKSAAMVEVIRACQGCRLLEVRDVAISSSAELMPAITRELLARYGDDWTDTLAINDIYFDYAAVELTKAGRPSASMRMLSAGDGSAAAFMRIRAGTFQVGTVAEPLNQQGWQLVDELNRLLAHTPLSGYVAPVHLVNRENIGSDGGPQGQYDPDNGYRNAYRHIWKP